MDREITTELMRLLHGELPESDASRLRIRLREEPELLQEFDSLQRLWRGLELPIPEPAPPGFSTRVVARARETADRGLAPAWWSHTLVGKAATALVLSSGIILGAILASPSEAEDWSEFLDGEPTMAESYLLVVGEPGDESWQENDS